MPTPFPGMDPYLERPGIWSQVHTNLIVEIQRHLARELRPKYTVAIEQRTYVAVADPSTNEGVNGWMGEWVKMSPPHPFTPSSPPSEASAAYSVEVPLPEEVRERYLEVRDQVTGEVITIIEILSPSNKIAHRRRYLRKRLAILGSDTGLVEIDLLHAGMPMPMKGNLPRSHYRILISRAADRPKAEALLFNVQQPIPDVPIPLRPGEKEPLLPLNELLHRVYDAGGYDLMVDYSRPPEPLLDEPTAEWTARQLSEG